MISLGPGMAPFMRSALNTSRMHPLCVNIEVASKEEANYGIFPSSEVKCVEESLAA
jgi:hypothetical protein